MQAHTTFRRMYLPALSAVLSLGLAFGQQQGGGQGGGAGAGGGQAPGGQAPGGQAPGGQPGTGRVPSPTQPGQMPGQMPTDRRSPFPDTLQRGIFLSGKVMMEDGSPPPEPVTIERVCGTVIRPEGYTDSKGRFSFQVGQNQLTMMDASVGSGDVFSGDPSGRSGGGAFGAPRTVTERDLMGCELRANLPGFRSDAVNLTGRRTLDNPNVGTIVLRRMAKVEGFTFSATTGLAPKDARKAFEKALDQAKKNKWTEAEQNLTKAVTVYPKYAIAWYELGRVYQRENKMDDAKRAYLESTKADAKFVNPYANLALVCVLQRQWDEAIQHSGQAIKLNPYLSPTTYFYSAVANYNKGNIQVAEEHVREAVKLDPQHKIPKANQLLAVILDSKGDFKGAAENMRIYLKAVPDAQDATVARQHLADLEKKASQ